MDNGNSLSVAVRGVFSEALRPALARFDVLEELEIQD
jgi:hypothetical protein